MSDFDKTLRQQSALSSAEQEAARLTQAAAAQGDVPPHPSVGDAVWQRVEAGLSSPPKRGLGPKSLLGGGALLLGAALVYLALRPAAPPRVVMEPGSVLIFASDDKHELRSGSATYEVTQQDERVGFSLTMVPWEISVTKSRFWVLKSDKENVIEVRSGNVMLHTGARDVELRAGDKFRESTQAQQVLDAASLPSPATAPAEKVIDPPDKPPPDATPRDPTMSEALEKVRAGQYREAEAMYRRIAERVPAQAEVALYALAKMKAHNQKNHARGLAILDELDARFGRGQLKQERMLMRIEILFRSARCAEAKAAVAQYVAEFTHAIASLREIDASQCEPPQ